MPDKSGVTRVFSRFNVKAVDEEQRTIEGIATTPSTDRLGDVVESEGAEFTLPVPFLWQHNAREPIGEVISASVSKDGISIKAKLAKIDEPGRLKDRLDEAWQSIKIGLVKGLSIGFSSIEEAFNKETYGWHFLRWNWLELSAVTIPANADASITAIKSADFRARRAAIGANANPKLRTKMAPSSPGAAGSSTTKQSPKGSTNMGKKTVTEQLSAWEAKRDAASARMEAIMDEASEKGENLSAEEEQEYDELKSEVTACDAHIVRLKDFEKLQLARASRVDAKAVHEDPKAGSDARETDPEKRQNVRERSGILSVRPNIEKAIPFTRYVKAMILGRNNPMHALQIVEANKGWMDQTPQVALVLRAAVVAGDTTTAGWASELVYNQNLVAEFIELLRPMTIIGRIPGLTQVPFNVRLAGQDSGSTAYWVGPGAPVPLSKLNTMEVQLGIAKAAGLVVLTDELVRSSDPSAEMLVRNDLTKSIAQFLDVHFVAPDYAEVANVSPASITNGVTPVAASGTNTAAIYTDIKTLFGQFIAANMDPSTAVWLMTNTQALAFSLVRNPLGQFEFPDINMKGGSFFGLPVITSQSVQQVGSPVTNEGQMIILANAADILMADDGNVTIDASREASLQMLDNPTNNSQTATPTTMVSMFQTNSVALKATRFINWKKKRPTAVAYIKDAAYVGG